MKRWRMTPDLGVDAGGVFIDNDAIDKNTGIKFPKHSVHIPEVEGAGEVLKYMSFLSVPTHVVTSSKPEVEEKRKRWMEWKRYDNAQKNFYEYTEIPPENVHFCEERLRKVPWCERWNIHMFVDNRADVLATMIGIVPRLYLFGPNPVVQGVAPELLEQFERVPTWRVLLPKLVNDVDAYRAYMQRKRRRAYGMQDVD